MKNIKKFILLRWRIRILFHDINSYGKLNSNLIGIPKEPFGFTNYDGKSPPGNFKKHKINITGNCKVLIPLVSF